MRAYQLHLQGSSAIQILRLNVSDLFQTLRTGSEDSGDSFIPVWIGPAPNSGEWLCMAEVVPLLGIDPWYIRPSEWLSCGPVLPSRLSAVWPIIGERLFFEEGTGHDLVALFTRTCGRMPDRIRSAMTTNRYEYNWNDNAFDVRQVFGVKPLTLRARGRFPTSALGLGVAALSFTRPTSFGHAGFLRGMVIMD